MIKKSTLVIAALGVASTGGVAFAEPSFSITGMLRQEISKNMGGANMHTHWGSPYNGRANVNHMSNLSVLGVTAANAGPGGTAVASSVITDSYTSRNNITPRDPDWTQFATRAEIDIQARFTPNLKGYMKIRGYREDAQHDFLESYDFFGDEGVKGTPPEAAVFAGGLAGNPKTFRNMPLDDGKGSLFEHNEEDYMLDLPALYLDYNNGPLWLRVGNQQIAWGEALFFRVIDSVQGLDLRRHSVLGVAAEEYSDSRIPSFAIRGSYRFDNEWELEAYAQQFRPTILPRPGTPYSLVAEAFTVYEEPGYAKDKDDVDVGFRYSGQISNWDISFSAIARTAPDGTYRWAKHNVDESARGIPDGLAFAPDPLGTASADEWFWGASWLRFNPVTTLDTSITDAIFATAAAGAGAFSPTATANALNAVTPGTTTPTKLAKGELDLFFNPATGFGPLRGYLHRDYDEEVIFGVSGKYVFMGEPDSLLDQLILGIEATYTPDRNFTNPSLSQQKLVEDEFTSVVSLEKYHKFSSKFPATYVVAQWMHKTESDMFGRHLSGNGSSYHTGGIPTGDSAFNAIAVAFQQPFPNLIWRADLSVLYDLEGGTLVQPGVKYRPRDNMQLDPYANFLNSDGGNDDIMGTLETQDEIFARLSFYF